ncbi:amino acid transporter [Streptosporangium becharense]|uniref:Amino acid transporter n=1 Tax=Streptosporangium becharense TaxID=1816182 RepID=A0A7W9IBU2_9ACTN|nr:APC family permease [Streptosporangium becharense]MBB2910836.1 amino acid transporter [Streptosporangium becharense]MBB5817531.1 amino acid transporter [Streptosporangium becharense]
MVTAPNHPAPPPGALRRVLGTPTLVVFGLAYMVPLTIFTTYGSVTQLTEGHLPTAYLMTLAAMLFTAVSYAVLGRAFPSAGSAYTYTQRSFGPHLGFMTGWTLMIDYLLLPMINYMVMGIYLNAQFPAVPTWVFVLGAIVVVTGLNVVGISVVQRANLVLVGVQIVFVVVFLALALRGAGDAPSLTAPLFDADMPWDGLFAGAAILCLSYLGFDAVSTLSEEARDPRRSVPRAIVLTTLIGGLIFTVVSYAAHLVMPDWRSITDPDSAALGIMTAAGGRWLEAFFLAAYIAGCVAAATASQVSVARVLFAMGRDGVLPKRVFGVLSPRFGTPVGATLVVAAVSLLALVLDLGTTASLISFGALFAFSLVNLTVVKHFVFDRGLRSPRDLLLYAVVPGVGFAMTAWLWLSLSWLALIVGLIWFGLGVAYLAVLTGGFRSRPPQLALDDSGVPEPVAGAAGRGGSGEAAGAGYGAPAAGPAGS